MMQLTFQPAYDSYHAIFRLFRLRNILESTRAYRDTARILDFYLLFPFRIDEIRLSPKHRGYRKLASTYSNIQPYGGLPESIIVFERMAPMQQAASETLKIQGFLDNHSFDQGIVSWTDKQASLTLTLRVDEQNKRQDDLLTFLAILATEYPLLGESGLKARTGLIEYRYDPV